MKRLARVLAIGALVLTQAPGCAQREADRVATARSDVATLGRFVTLHPVPVAAKWSVTTIGKDAMFGPSDTVLWAVVRYSDADFAAVARVLKADALLPAVTADAPPAWLLAEADLARFRHGSDFVFAGPVSAGGPFASGLYSTGFALALPGRRVLIHFSSQ